MTEKKDPSVWSNPAIIIAIIGLCGTVITGIFASPILLEMIRASQATDTPVPPVPGVPPADTPIPTITEPPAIVSPTETSFSTPTSTELPTLTPTITLTPTSTFTATPVLADLQIVAISEPGCVRDHRVTPTRYYARHTITVRNMGSGSTAAFGEFSIRVTLDTGGQRYTLEEWATRFNGVSGNPNLIFGDLGPNQEAETILTFDLHGLTKYSLEVIANSGAKTIPESNTTNNILSRGFAITNCP